MPKRGDLRRTEIPANALVASATFGKKIPTAQGSIPKSNSRWQEALWGFYDTVGEFEYVANWTGNMLSCAELYVAKDGVRTKETEAVTALNELFGSTPGKEAALRLLGIHYAVAGESYIVTYKEGGETVWRVLPPQVVSKDRGGWKIGNKAIPTSEQMVIRTWQPHPRLIDEATSPSRAAIPILNEIFRLTQHIDAQVSSRLASAGILLMPNEITFSSSSTNDDETVTNESSADEFVSELMKTMGTAINDRSDASALVPIVVTAEGEHLDKPRLLEFWSKLDEHAKDLRAEGIGRLALTLDVPPEVLTGTSDASHWQAWGVSDDAIKAHTEPLLKRLCGDLTEGYLWASLKGVVADEDLKRYTIMADTSGMRMRPNRSREAVELYDRGELKPETLRRETGFEETDKPTPKEHQQWLTKQIAKGSTTPEMVTSALGLLGVEVSGGAGETADAPAPPSLQDHPDNKAVPDQQEQDDLAKDVERKRNRAALVAAAEQMVFRALERGGSRIMNRTKFKPNNIEAPEVYLYRATTDAEASFMLEGSFDHCARFAERYGVNSQALAATLDEYCRSLIMDRKPYNVDDLARRLEVMEVAHVG